MNSLNDIVKHQIEKQLIEYRFYEEDEIDFTDVLIGTYETLDPEGYIETDILDSFIRRIFNDVVYETVEEYNYGVKYEKDIEETEEDLNYWVHHG